MPRIAIGKLDIPMNGTAPPRPRSATTNIAALRFLINAPADLILTLFFFLINMPVDLILALCIGLPSLSLDAGEVLFFHLSDGVRSLSATDRLSFFVLLF